MRTYKVERKMVPKSVAQRRNWAKFGMSKGDKAGPNPQTTVVAEEIWLVRAGLGLGDGLADGVHVGVAVLD